MKVTLFMAISVNGMIARPDYREDFLSRENWDSFLDCARETGAMVWGRKTHEKVRAYGAQYFQQLAGLRNVVVSSQAQYRVDEPGFEVARSPQLALQQLAARGCSRATLAGGSILNTAAARGGLIDDIIVNVESVVIGRGIPLFEPGDFDLRLSLLGVQQINERILQLRYAVIREAPSFDIIE